MFVRLIRMLVVPVVFFSIAGGVAALADPARLGSLGGRALLLFFVTTLLAVAIGMAVAVAIEPGHGLSFGLATAKKLGASRSVGDQLIAIVPLNVVDSLAKGDMLPIIFFAGLFGVGTLVAREEGRAVAALLASASAVLLRVVRIAMEFTPLGVFALVANAVASDGAMLFVHVGRLALGVILGSIAQIVLVHIPLLALAARYPLRRFFRGVVDPLAIAFSTASSSATLPVAIRAAEEKLGVSRMVAATVLPLGASIGKDGTAMYVGLLAIFSLQALHVPLTAATAAIVWMSAALAAFGTAPVPSASLFMLAAVLSAVGVPAGETALVVGFVLPFDRILDMIRTVPSACANLTITTTIARWEGELSLVPTDLRGRAGL